MRLISRSRPRQVDPHLTYFTLSEANEFRRLVERSFAAAGRDVAVQPDHVVDRSGTILQLWNIGALCLGASPSDWPELIDEHVRLVTTPVTELGDLSQDELEAGLHLRLVATTSVPDPDRLGHARVVAPGLLEVLSVDLPDSVATPSREELEVRGTVADLVALGRDNLRSLLTSGAVRAEAVGEAGQGSFTAVKSDSIFTASLALLLQETVERFGGEHDWGRGILVAVPYRHQLLYRPIDRGDAALALQRMLQVALPGFAAGPGALSPDVFWVRNNRWDQVTSYESGKPRMLRSTGLREALKAL
jgi:hypothetical protein